MIRLLLAAGAIATGLGAGLALGAPVDLALIIVGTGIAVALLLLGARADEAEASASFAMADEHAPPPPPPALHDHPGFRQLADALPDPVLIVGGDRVLFANPAARALLGAHIVGADIRIAIRHPVAADRLASSSASSPAASSAGSADPSTDPAADSTAGADSETIDLIGLGRLNRRFAMRIVALDDTRFVTLSDRTAQDLAERMRADFVANASHELRTPLAGIIGFIETLADPAAGADAATRARFLGIMDREARRLKQLVDDLLSLSRIEADKFRQPTDPVDLAALTEEVLAAARDLAPDGDGARLTLDRPAALLLVHGDRVQLSQMLHNIIGNALKYGQPGTPVAVRLDRDDAMARVIVADQGDGIPAEHIPRLTERFYRVDAARSRSLGGTGLGLSLVKHIVERHRGRLDIASTPGRGTTVTVALPVAVSAAR